MMMMGVTILLKIDYWSDILIIFRHKFQKIYIDLSACRKTWQHIMEFDWLIIIHYSAFFGTEGHVAFDRNPGPRYNTVLLWLIPGDLLSACPHRQFHTLHSLLDRRAALLNSYTNACIERREAVYTIFMMVFGMTRLGHEPATYERGTC